MNSKPAASRWRLWVDGCGGFLILSGDSWTIGGASPAGSSDVRIHSDLPRVAGTLSRREDSYFWEFAGAARPAELILSGHPLSMTGSASLIFRHPSPLSRSAVLTLMPPHRFDGHVDGVILADETLLMGATADCHIKAAHLGSEKVVMTRRGDRWLGKVVGDTELSELTVGQRMEVGEVEMTLEKA
ncbi:hypothetical protein [Novipirellula maiorica]|uniref:hypothetical protein n=1 Tax=Novipirellula maiorica TaxID=1265734 RepID=UPI000344D4D5|nr:hypothetical protein [Rhodopirellula maiorica]